MEFLKLLSQNPVIWFGVGGLVAIACGIIAYNVVAGIEQGLKAAKDARNRPAVRTGTINGNGDITLDEEEEWEEEEDN